MQSAVHKVKIRQIRQSPCWALFACLAQVSQKLQSICAHGSGFLSFCILLDKHVSKQVGIYLCSCAPWWDGIQPTPSQLKGLPSFPLKSAQSLTLHKRKLTCWSLVEFGVYKLKLTFRWCSRPCIWCEHLETALHPRSCVFSSWKRTEWIGVISDLQIKI